MKLFTIRSLLLAPAIGLVLCILALGVRSSEWMHPSRWDLDTSAGPSDEVRVAVWGWPLYCAVDHPWQGREGRLDPLSELVPDRMAANWLFFTLLVFYARGLWAVLSRRTIVPQPLAPAFASPMTVFLVMQALLPWTWPDTAELTLRQRLLDSTLLALIATIAAYGVMLVVGLPIAWVLERTRSFRPAVVAPVGAAIGFLPYVFVLFQESPKAATELADFYVVVAVAGSLCALTYWAFSGRGCRPAAASGIAGAARQLPE